MPAGGPLPCGLSPCRSLTSKRPQCRPALLQKKTRHAWDQEIAWLGKTPAQVSLGSWGNFCPNPSARHGHGTPSADALTACPSPRLPSPSRPRATASKAGRPAGPLPPALGPCTQLRMESVAPSDKEAVTMVSWLYRQTDAATSGARVSLRSVQSLGSQPPAQDRMLCVRGRRRKSLQTGPSVPRRTGPSSLPARPQSLRHPKLRGQVIICPFDHLQMGVCLFIPWSAFLRVLLPFRLMGNGTVLHAGHS